MEAEVKVPTAGGQLLEFCLKSIGQHEKLDANTMLALLSLVNLTNILELIAQGNGKQTLMLPSPQVNQESQKAADLIPPGSDKAALLNNLMSMLGGGGDLGKLMPLVSMLGNALKNNQQAAEKQEPPKQEEKPVEEASEAKDEKEPRPLSGWARVGR